MLKFLNSLPSLHIAGGLVLSICSGTYIVSRKPSRMTAEGTSYMQSVHTQDNLKVNWHDRLTSTRFLPSSSPDTQQYVGILSRLAEHQQSIFPPPGTGIVRYDIAKIARCVLAFPSCQSDNLKARLGHLATDQVKMTMRNI
jgi:hypothetical protein